MDELAERESNLRNRNKRAANREYLPASLGDETGRIGDGSVPGHVFVRLQTSLGLSKAISVRGPVGRLIQLTPGAPVELEWDKKGRLFVAALDSDMLISMQVDPVALSQRVLSPRTTQDSLETLWCFQSTPPSTVVNVKAWQPIVGNRLYMFPGGSLDLGVAGANVIPPSGYQAWVVVFIKSDYLTLEATSCTAVTTLDLLDTQAAINECLASKTANSTAIWALLLSNAQTTIRQANIVPGQTAKDLRGVVNTSDQSGGGGGAANILTSGLGYVLVDGTGHVITSA